MSGRTSILLAAVLLLATSLRCYQIGKSSFWIDELISTEQTTGMGLAHEHLPADRFLPTPHAATALNGAAPWWTIWTSLKADNQPPLYYLALRAWRDVFGEGDVAARSLSAAASVIGVVLLFAIVQLLQGDAAALWAALIMAMAGPQIEFSQETCCSTMAMTLALAMVLMLVRIEKIGVTPTRMAGLAIFALAALLTDYTAAAIVLVALLYALVRLPAPVKWRASAAVLIAVLGFVVMWGGAFLHSAHLAANDSGRQSIGLMLTRWASLPVHLFVNGEIEPQAIAMWSVVLYIMPLALLRRRRDLLLWAMWILLATIPLAMLDARGFGNFPGNLLGSMRFTLIAAPAAYAIVAGMLADQPGYRRHAIALVLSLCCLLTLPDAYVRWKEDWRGFAQYVASCCQPGDVLVLYRKDESDLNSDAIYLALSHYLPHGDANGSFEVPIVVVRGPVAYPLLRQIDGARRVWVVNPDLGSVATDLFPGGKVSGERPFPIFPFPATIARIEPTPMGIPFLQ